MTRKRLRCLAVATGLVSISVGAWASGEKGAAEPVKKLSPAATSIAKPSYKPPLRGAPSGRVGGGTRGASERESFSLLVLAPDHLGYTVTEQPCLYWYISRATTFSVELTVIERNAVKPLLEKVIPWPSSGGVQGVCLADHGVKLKKNVAYKWFVTLVADAQQRSKDILAGGIVSYVDPSPALSDKLSAAGEAGSAAAYAEEGVWYDAVAAVSRRIAAAPGNAELRRARGALLEQVGLKEIAEHDLR